MGNEFFENINSKEQLSEMNRSIRKNSGKFDIIFVVDISGSMDCPERIGAVNDAFRKMVEILKKVQADVKSECEMRISIITFDKSAECLVEPVPIDEYYHSDIVCRNYCTFYSKAFEELKSKMTETEFFDFPGKIFCPFIMFMTDGEPTSGDDYKSVLDDLMKNKYFAGADRYALLIGQDVRSSKSAHDAVSYFLKNKEAVLYADSADKIADIIVINTLVSTMGTVSADGGKNTEKLEEYIDESGFGSEFDLSKYMDLEAEDDGAGY